MAETADMQAVVEAIRGHDRFLVTTHENPDGDALGSLLATHLALTGLGKDSVMVMAGTQPLPVEYGFFELEARGLRREPPADRSARVVVAVDCAQASRIADESLLADVPLTVNIDHHHDNTRFADVNVVAAEMSSTGEALASVFDLLGVQLVPELAEALYTAIVTDTGRFQYSNTSPAALRLAAALVEAGADVGRVFEHVYESVDFAKVKLLGHALEHARLLEDGRVVVSFLTRGDFADAGATEPYSEGIIDHLRAVEGTVLAALIRELPPGAGTACKISLRASDPSLDVSAIARASGGGGHPQAAGFSSNLGIEEIVDFVVRGYRAATGAPAAA